MTGRQLHADPDRALALRGMVKLPTGELSNLAGSGAADYAMWAEYADHRLLESFDPLGRRGIRTEYDADGRVIATVDGAGYRYEVEHDIPGRREITVDRLGNSMIQEYDEQGNVVAVREHNFRIRMDVAVLDAWCAMVAHVSDAR